MLNKAVMQIKREFWEHKTGFLRAPIILTVLLVIAFTLVVTNHNALTVSTSFSFGSGHSGSPDFTGGNTHGTTPLEQSQASPDAGNKKSFDVGAPGVLAMALTLFQGGVVIFLWILFAIVLLGYAHSCLFDDRKNREILFWRSMPVSETLNVLTKIFIIGVVVPSLVLLLSVLAGLAALVVGMCVVQDTSQFMPALASLSTSFLAFAKSVVLAVAMLPVIGWVLCASAAAKKSPFLISSALPIIVWVLDAGLQKFQIANLHIKEGLANYTAFLIASSRSFDADAALTGTMVASYIGALVVGGALVALAIWLRNNRYEI